ncbi:MAG: Hsp20/alpha crystallin family protein [Acidobacteriota bacterium]|nr:Hsp20/alpha crystallin family protein [Acidobacteriota bacterium]
MGFTHWDPLRDLLALRARLDQLAGSTSDWLPPIDVYETADRFIVTAEVPGMTRDQMDVRVEGGRVTVTGERPGTAAGERYHRIERGHGRFSRSFVLDQAIDAAAVSADLRDGVLTVSIPKAPGAAPRRIDVG